MRYAVIFVRDVWEEFVCAEVGSKHIACWLAQKLNSDCSYYQSLPPGQYFEARVAAEPPRC